MSRQLCRDCDAAAVAHGLCGRHLDPAYRPALLDQLGGAVAELAYAVADVDRLVVAAKLDGATWAAIAEQLGTSKQATWERYGDAVKRAELFKRGAHLTRK